MIGEKIQVFFSSRCSATSRENIMTGTRWARLQCVIAHISRPDRPISFLHSIRMCTVALEGLKKKALSAALGSIINLFSQPKNCLFFSFGIFGCFFCFISGAKVRAFICAIHHGAVNHSSTPAVLFLQL